MAVNGTWYECFFLPLPDFKRVDERQLTNTVTAVINAAIMPIAITGNILIIAAVFQIPVIQTPSNVLLACLAFSDLLVALIVQPLFVAFRLIENSMHFVPCGFRVVYSESFWVCYGVSFIMLSAISFERYIALRLHLRYKNVVTTRCIIRATIFIWVVDIVLTSCQWLELSYLKVRSVQIGLFLLCVIITLVIQIQIFRILLWHQKQIQTQEAQRSGSFHKQTKLAINVTYIVGFYLLCNMPVIIVQLCQFAIEMKFDTLNIYGWVETVAFLNSTLNPLVCYWRNKDVREGMIRILRRVQCRRKRQRSRSTMYFIPGTGPRRKNTPTSDQTADTADNKPET